MMECVRSVRFASLAIFACAFGLAACGGGGHSLPSLLGSNPVTGSGGAASSAKKATLKLKIKIPAKTTTSATKRAPQYVSAGSQTLVIYAYPLIAPTPSAATATIDLNPSDPGSACTLNSDGSRSCTVSFAAPDGNDVVTIDAYGPAPSPAPYPIPSGLGPNGAPLLSAGTMDTTIAPNTVNSLNLTLEGVIAGLQFSRTALFLQSSASANQISVNATDAEGNIIVSDTYANPITVTATNDPFVSSPSGGGGCSSGSTPAFTLNDATSTTLTVTSPTGNNPFMVDFNGAPCQTWASTLTTNSSLTATTTIPGTNAAVSATPMPVYPDFYIFTGASGGSGTIEKVDPGQNLVTDSVTHPAGTLVGLAAAAQYQSIAFMVDGGGGNSTIGTYGYNGLMAQNAGTTYSVTSGAALWFDSGAAGTPSLYALGGGSTNPVERYPLTPPAPPTYEMELQAPAPSPLYSATIPLTAIAGTNYSLASPASGTSDCVYFGDTADGSIYALADNGSSLPATYNTASPFYPFGANPGDARDHGVCSQRVRHVCLLGHGERTLLAHAERL